MSLSGHHEKLKPAKEDLHIKFKVEDKEETEMVEPPTA
jgi:hypothetical protein